MTVQTDRKAATPFALISGDAITASLQVEWDDLARHASEPNSFYERWFVEASLRHLECPETFRLLTVRDAQSTLIGLLPLRSGQTYGRTPFLAVENWLHYNQLLGAPLVRKGAEKAFWREVVASFDRNWPGADILYFSEMPRASPVTDALFSVCKELGRRNAIVHRYSRALLEAGEAPDAYWAAVVRKKKRKEIARLENRLAELGDVRIDTLRSEADADSWIAAFLALEAAGWKAEAAALAVDARTRAFFVDAVKAGLQQGRIEILRMHIAGQTIAMLVNFLAAQGAFSFKIAYDEAFARYSPGILIEKANLQRLSDPDFGWMDSCAIENHPMINSLWRGRREIVRIALPRKGARALLLFQSVRLAEAGWSAFKRFRARGQNDNGTRNNDDEL